MFKKKVSTQKPQSSGSITMSIEELPTQALQITYETLMDKYDQNQDENTQKKLIYISKILTDRAYEQGNGKLYNEIRKLFPSITEEQFKKMSKEDRQRIQQMIQVKRDLDQAVKKMTEPTEEKIEITIKDHTAGRKHIQEELPPFDIDSTPKPKKKKGFFASLNKPIFTKETKTVSDEELAELNNAQAKTNKLVIEENERISKQKKKKQSGFGFFKKKVKTTKNQQVIEDMLTGGKPKEEQKEKATAKTLFKSLKKEKKEDPNKQILKGLEEVYCYKCKHSIVVHQKNGVNTGCRKCGCLRKIEKIAEENEIELKKPAEVLDNIKKETDQIIEESIPNEPIGSEFAKTPDEIEQQKYIAEQAAKIASMTNAKPKPKATAKLLSKEEQMQQEINDLKEQQINVDGTPKPKGAPPQQPQTQEKQCTCDHQMDDHYDNDRFCTIVGCSCEKFNPYP